MLDIAALLPDGSTCRRTMELPEIPLLDNALSAFARGTVLQASHGEIAVEDLRPGDSLRTTAGQDACVTWIGMTRFDPKDTRHPLVRIMPDSFGEGRPESFLTLGAAARILQTPPRFLGQFGKDGLLTPVRAFLDAVNVIEVNPPTPVPVFHIVLDRHAVIRTSGLECETFHPGATELRKLPEAQMDDFMSLFPRLGRVTDFGPLAHPRAPCLTSDVD